MRVNWRIGTALATVLAFLLPVAAEAAPPVNWTGPYLGAALGVVDTGSTVDFSDISDYQFDSTGYLAGLTAGYSVQTGNIVWGVEGDASRGTVKADGDYSEALDSLLTLRGRIGVTNGPVLAYATAGLAGGQVDYSIYRDAGKGVPVAATNSGFVTGPIMGAGVEVAVTPQVSLKTEALVYRLGGLEASGETGKGSYTTDYRPEGFVLRSGVNLHF